MPILQGVSTTESCEALEKKAATVTELSIKADKRLTDLRPFAAASATSRLSLTITSCSPETLSNIDALQGLKNLGSLDIEVKFATPDDKKQSRCSNKTWLEKLSFGRVSGGFKSLVTLGVSFWATKSDDPSIQVIDFSFAKEINSGQTNRLESLMVSDLATSSFSGAEGLVGISTLQVNAGSVSDLSPLLPIQSVSIFDLEQNSAITSAKCPIDSANVKINNACLAKFPR